MEYTHMGYPTGLTLRWDVPWSVGLAQEELSTRGSLFGPWVTNTRPEILTVGHDASLLGSLLLLLLLLVLLS